MRSKQKNQSKLMKIVLLPLRILSKARDFYMKSMEDCAGKVGYGGGMMGGPGAHVASLPKSFSSRSLKNDDEEFCDLLRVISKRNMEREMRETGQGNGGMGRSYSVGVGKIGRIDENEPCSFEEDDVGFMYGRSRSHALKRNVVYY